MAVAFAIVASVGVCRGALAGVPATKPAAWLQAAATANERGDTAARWTYVSLAVKARPNDVDALFMQGRFASYDGRYDLSVSTLRRALSIAPKYRDIQLHLARVLGWAGRYDEAALEADELTESYPDWVEARVVRGDIALWSGDATEAEAAYRSALELDPGNIELEAKVLSALVTSGDTEAVRAFLETLDPADDDRDRARLRKSYLNRDADMRFDAVVGYTFTDPGDWTTWSLGASLRIREPVWVGFRVDWEQRIFGAQTTLRETTLAMPVSIVLADRYSLALEGAYTPDASFAPVGRANAELRADVVPALGLGFGYRFSRYTEQDAHTIYPSLTFRVRPLDITPVLLATFTNDGQTGLSARLKVLWHVSDRGEIEVWGFAGTETLDQSTSLTLDSPLQAGFLFSVGQEIRPLTRLRFVYSYSTPLEEIVDADGRRPGVNARHTIALAWTQKLRFGRGATQ